MCVYIYYNIMCICICTLCMYVHVCICSAKPNESLKLMLVGLQKMGKTTLLSRLREVNEAQMIASTFNERVKGVEKITSARHTGLGSRVRKKGG